MRNESGFMLVGALSVLLVLFVLGGAAMLFSELGYFTVSSERQYEKAQGAAEYAVNEGVRYVSVNRICPPPWGPVTLESGAKASYSSVPVGIDGCFIHGVGTFSQARAVKTGLVNFEKIMDIAAIMMRDGGTLDIDKNALVANCEPSCPAPAVMYGDQIENKDSPPIYNNVSCSVALSKGIWGSPYAIVNADGIPCNKTNGWCPKSKLLPDLVPKIFNAANWSDLLNQLSGSYMDNTGNTPKMFVDIPNFTVTGVPKSADAPKVSSSCSCKKLPGDSLTSSTTTCSDPVGKSIAGCAALEVTQGQVKVSGFPSGMNTLVVTNDVVNFVGIEGGVLQNKTIYLTKSDKDMTIDDINAVFNNVSFIARKKIVVNKSKEMNKCTLVAEGKDPDSIKTTDFTGRFYDSRIVSIESIDGAGAILDGGGLERSAVVVRKKAVYNAKQAMKDAYIFAREIEIKKDLADNVEGSLIYSSTSTKFEGDSRFMMFGTPEKPVLVLSGYTVEVKLRYSDFNGIIFSDDVIKMTEIKANVRGVLASNGTNLARKGSKVWKGNRYTITVDRQVLDNLKQRINLLTGKQIVKDPVCGRLGTAALNNTKVLAY